MFRKYLNKIFIYLICFFIIFIYAVNTKIVWIDMMEQSPINVLYIAIFTLTTIMLVWCLFQTMFTDPGKVPQNWGYFLNDPEQKKRRFCLTCHIFKPERCHHCSACNRCVLNMDHHCPWINNCVGFYNRKYFLQMLFYTILDSAIAVIGLAKGLLLEIHNLSNFFNQQGDGHFLAGFLVLIAFGISCLAICLITMFFKFHLELVFSNRTTIENLERKRNEETGQTAAEVNPYDLKKYYNWVQVFGTKKLLWFIPITGVDGRPVGDGILWPKRQIISDSDNTKDALPSPINQNYNQGTELKQTNGFQLQSNTQFQSNGYQQQFSRPPITQPFS